MTPDWSIDLNRMVSGKGNFTAKFVSSLLMSIYIKMQHTDNKAREEGIDPAHDQGLRDHHHHVSLKHSHHSFHACGVGHGVRGRLATVVGVLQKCAVAESSNHVALAHLEGLAVKHGAGIVAEIHATEKSKALARLGKSGWRFGGRVHQDRGIVAKDSGQDLFKKRG